MLLSQYIVPFHQVHCYVTVPLADELPRVLVFHDVEEAPVDERAVLVRQLRETLHEAAIAQYLEQLVSALGTLLLQNRLNEVLSNLTHIPFPRKDVYDHLLHIFIIVELDDLQKVIIDECLERFESVLLAICLIQHGPSVIVCPFQVLRILNRACGLDRFQNRYPRRVELYQLIVLYRSALIPAS